MQSNYSSSCGGLGPHHPKPPTFSLEEVPLSANQISNVGRLNIER
jgi:hypothetical protein